MTSIPLKMIPRLGLALLFWISLAGGAPAIVPAQPVSNGPERDFASAVALYEQQLYPAATTALEAFREAHPTHPQVPEALYLEAKSALAQEQGDEARRLLDRLQREFPSYPRAVDAKLRLAQHYLAQNEVEQAKAHLEGIVAAPHGRAEAAQALYLLGRTEQRQNNAETALSYFQRTYSDFPEASVAPAALYATATAQLQLERYDAAASSFETLGQQYPDSPFAQNLGTALGEVYYRLDRYEQTISELEQRLPNLQGDQRARALFLLAESFNQLRRGAEAETYYQQVLNDHPNSPYGSSARYGLGWHYYFSNQHQEAAEAFRQVRAGSDPALAASATYYAAVNRALSGATDEALQLYRSVLKTNPGERLAAEARYEIGLLLYQQEQYDEAAASFRALIREHPTSDRRGDANYWLGNAYLAANDLDRALESYEQASERNAAPDSLQIEARFQHAWSQYQDEQYGEAAASFVDLSESFPNTPRGREALFWGGDSFYKQGNLARARSLFQRYLEGAPQGEQRAGALYALAWTHFKERRFDASARLFEQFLNVYNDGSTSIPYRRDAQLRLADSYFAAKQYDQAITAYVRVEGAEADYAQYQRGKALSYSDRPGEAIGTLRAFVEQHPHSPWRPDAMYRIGEVHFRQQNYEAAREAYRRLLDAYPNDDRAPEAQYGIADSYYNAGAMEEAVGAYRSVLETYPQHPLAEEAASSLFFALSAAGQQDRSDELITEIAEANPDANLGDRLRFHRARAAYQRGESERALRLFRDFVRTSSLPSLVPQAYYYLGVLHANQDNNPEAKNYLQQLVNQYPQSEHFPEGALRLGDINLDQENYEAAMEAYRAAGENAQTPDELRAQAHYGQSMALLQLGRSSEAETLLTDLLDRAPGGPLQASARLGLARIRAEQGQSGEALQLYRTVVDATDSQTGAEALYRLGRILRTQGQPEEAIRELNRMPSLFPGYPEWEARALLEQARAYESMGQRGQASQLYDEVLNTYAGTPFAQTAQKEKSAL